MRAYAGHVGVDAVGELLFPQFVPDMFLRVELGRVWRQAKQSHVLWHNQVLRHVRACAVHHHDYELAPVGSADLSKEFRHPDGIHLASDHPVQLPLHRTDGAVDIEELALVAVAHRGSHRLLSPAAANAHHAPESSLVLEHQADPSATDLRGIEEGIQHIGEFFFHCSCVAGSLLGCRVSGATLRQP